MRTVTRTGPFVRLRGALALTARAALELVLPITCAGCGSGGVRICPVCIRSWSQPPRRCEEGAARWDWLEPGGPPPVWALAVNDGSVRRVLVAWKDRGRADLTGWLAEAAGRAGRWLATSGRDGAPSVTGRAGPACPAGSSRRAVTAERPGAALLVVPAPASPSGARRRGEDLVARLACAVAVGLTGGGVPARAWLGLRLTGGRDQAGLGARGRAVNRSGRVRVRRRWAATGAAARARPVRHRQPRRTLVRRRSPRRTRPVMVRGARVLLVDDVLTTGATLAECRRVLEARGARVVGALVLAVTLVPGAQAGRLETRADRG